MQGKHESGEGRVGCVIWLIVVLVIATIAWKFVPVKIQTAELEDFMVEQAKFAPNLPAARIKRHIVDKAAQLGLPLKGKDCDVNKAGGRIRMKCTYMVPLEFPGYTYEWNIVHEVDRPIFLF